MKRRIILGVTDPVSLHLMDGLPAYLAGHWDVEIVAGCDPGGVNGASVHVVPMRRDPAPCHDLLALVRWIRLLRRVRPAVIVTGTPKAGLLGMLAGWLTRTPRRIYWLRGLRAETATGLRRLLLLALEGLAVATATDVLVVSESLAEELARMRLAPARKVTLLGSGSSNGVDTNRFAPMSRNLELLRDLGLNPQLPTVGFVGRITEDKGLFDLTRALIELNLTVPFQLLLVGRQEATGLRAELTEQLEQASVLHHFVDHVQDVAPFYAAMDVLCLPSLREGFPNVVLEAAACGVPAVCSDATGCRDAVVDGVTGRLFRRGDYTSLAAGIGELLLDESVRVRMGAAARRRVELEFERTDVWALLQEFFSSEPVARSPVGRWRRPGPKHATNKQGAL